MTSEKDKYVARVATFLEAYYKNEPNPICANTQVLEALITSFRVARHLAQVEIQRAN